MQHSANLPPAVVISQETFSDLQFPSGSIQYSPSPTESLDSRISLQERPGSPECWPLAPWNFDQRKQKEYMHIHDLMGTRNSWFSTEDWNNFRCESRESHVSVEKLRNAHKLGPVSRKSRKLFGPEKLFVKLRLAYSVKLVFSYVVKKNKNLNNCKVSCFKMPLLWGYKENYVTRNASEKLRDFRETGSTLTNIVKRLSSRWLTFLWISTTKTCWFI